MADLEVAPMTDEEFAAHWRERSELVTVLPCNEAKIQLLSMQIDWFEGEGENRSAYRINKEFRTVERVHMLRDFTKRIHHNLFKPSVG